MAGYGLGSIYNVVPNASGVHVYLRDGETIDFITFEDDGTTIATTKESIAGASEQALDVTNNPVKGPGIGGTWTVMAEQDDTLSLLTDATNDSMVFSVSAASLSDTFNCVEVTVDGGVVLALILNLNVQRKPANLQSSVV